MQKPRQSMGLLSGVRLGFGFENQSARDHFDGRLLLAVITA
jgi:hypothetical protein